MTGSFNRLAGRKAAERRFSVHSAMASTYDMSSGAPRYEDRSAKGLRSP
jgi:hypothetical protein